MKTIQFLSGITPGWMGGFIFLISVSLSGCYTVMKNSADYYSEFDTTVRKKEISRDSLIVQNEYETEEYADSTETDETWVEETSGSKTVIINRFYDDPWYSWNYYNPYYQPYSGWRMSIGAVYYDPYWYNPYWHTGYYYGWCCYPNYYDPWYYPHYYGSGGGGGYSHYQRRDYGMRKYQLNPVTPGGSGAFMGGGSRMTTTSTGAVQTSSGGQGRTYRDPNSASTGSRQDGGAIEKSKTGTKRKYKSNDKIKPGPVKSTEKSGKGEGRQFKEKDSNQKKDKDNSTNNTRTERSTNSNSGSQGRDANSGGGSRGGRDYNSGSSGSSGRSGGSDGGSRGGSGGGRDYNRPTRK